MPHLEQLKFPILAANLNYSNVPNLTAIELLKRSTVVSVNGTDVGIIGYITPETNELSLVDEVDFTDEIKAIKYACLVNSHHTTLFI